jgi:predicted ATPase
MLLWSWHEHSIAAAQLGEPQTSQVVLLIDEIESHLHPRWQRSILASLLKLVSILHKNAQAQIISATHSALILAAAEPTFDPERDAWFDLDVDRTSKNGTVELRKRTFVRHGDVSRWLTSDAFDLRQPTTLEAEAALG